MTEGQMTSRERFLNVFHFEDADHVPDNEFGYWASTVDRWHNEGLPLWVTGDQRADLFFGFERRDVVPVHVPFHGFKHEVLGGDDRVEIVRDSSGVVQKRWKAGVSNSIPSYVEFPVKDRETWESYRNRYDLTGIRYPSNWDELKEGWKERDYPLGVGGGGFFGWVRGMMGLKAALRTFYSDPDLIKEMFDFRAEMTLRAIEKSVREVEIDFSSWWEDMCYNSGPLISPKLFEEFMVPQIKKITSVLIEHGVDISWVDCDGDITKLAPLWLEAGINCMFPLEIRGNTDPAQLRETYGKDVLLMGGVDKVALAGGPAAIDAEIERIRPLLATGGYVPHVDHRVPADVSYDNYLYYLKKKRQLLFSD
jgi:uroporphyrinogen decarboxylase